MIEQFCQRVSGAAWFQNLILGVILFAAVLVGIETEPGLLGAWGGWLHGLDRMVLGIFTVELLVRLGAFGNRPWLFFRDGWNVFDFVVVAVCFLPIHAEFAAVLRLVRVLRVLRLITAVPRLQLLVGALLKSIPSMGYVAVLLLLHFYVYAVVGVSFFREHDADKFGSIPVAMLTLFEIVTLEGWVDVMGAQLAVDSLSHQLGAVFYFITFILTGTMIMLNLLIGVIMKSMEEAENEMATAKKVIREQNAGAREKELEEILVEMKKSQERLVEWQKGGVGSGHL